MTIEIPVPPPMDGRDPGNLRSDPITGDRYFSPDFAKAEWEGLWTRIWHVAGCLADIPEPGDFIVHDFLKQSIIAVRQVDGSVRAFHNSCGRNLGVGF